MREEDVSPIIISSANAWWNALPDITKIAIYEDLWDILENERSAG